ncbi:MAG: exo-alpha-sialidase [Bryobacterales bacterium]|nr:exo-alpha-sialidase [Bryobacterales bacterium]
MTGRRQLLQQAIAAPLAFGAASARPVATGGLQGCQLLPGAEFFVSIDNKGLWPNLTKLPGGEIAAAVYNHPSHGYGSNSDVELWVSHDGGMSWQFRSRITDHPEEPNAIRMNHAVGLNAKGELVALVSGYHEGQKLPVLPVQRCISADQGRTWRRDLLEMTEIPHGDIFLLPDGRLVCPVYGRVSVTPRRSRSAVYFSENGGETWGNRRPVADGSETFVLRLRSGAWLAAARTNCLDPMDGVLPHGSGEALLRSDDEGRSWSAPKLISPQGQENAHLLELRDGRILCSFTSRIPGLFGVVLRMSEDGGATWSLPVVLLSAPATDWRKTDSGYPSSVELDDGTIVTAYYFGPKRPEWAAHGLPWHQRYHMGVARWKLSLWPA